MTLFLRVSRRVNLDATLLPFESQVPSRVVETGENGVVLERIHSEGKHRKCYFVPIFHITKGHMHLVRSLNTLYPATPSILGDLDVDPYVFTSSNSCVL